MSRSFSLLPLRYPAHEILIQRGPVGFLYRRAQPFVDMRHLEAHIVDLPGALLAAVLLADVDVKWPVDIPAQAHPKLEIAVQLTQSFRR